MFIGHFAVGLAAKRAMPGVPLGVLFVAAQLPDLIWPVLVLTGVETVRVVPGHTAVTPLEFISYPISHSLLTVVAWGLGLAFLWHRLRGQRHLLALTLVVASHWLLDALSHAPDMPLWPGGPKVGLGLWHSVAATVAVEGALFALGAWLYLRATRPRDRAGSCGFWGLMVFLVVVYGANLAGPPPPGATAVAVGALAMWLLVGWGQWADRHRTAAPR